MIKDLEAELAGSTKEISNTDNSAVAEEANSDEDITAESKDRNYMKNYLKDKKISILMKIR